MDARARLDLLGIEAIWRLRADTAAGGESVHGAEPATQPPDLTGNRSSQDRPVAPGVSDRHEGMPVPGSSPDRSIKAIAGMDWTAIEAGVAACSACGLCRSRHRTVFGAGNPRASLMIIGEAPGADEDASGVPFVGQAGKLLDSMLASLGLVRERDVYIANVLKCRPPANRDPQPDEVARCAPWLERQIELVSPRLILAMGRLAAQTLLATESSIAGLRGRTHVSRDRPVLVSYHPAWLLRTPADKARAWEDLLQVREALGSAPGDSPGMSTD